MTANATFPDTGTPSEFDDPPDDLDLGFDTLINRYATHRLHDAGALARLRPDLARIIAPPEVTFAAYLADGTIVLCCPEGIPPSLNDVVDVLDPTHPLPQAAPAQVSTAAPPVSPVAPIDLTDRLDAMSRKLDLLQRDTSVGSQIADRLEEVKTALLDGLAKATTRNAPADAVTEGPDPQALAADMLGTIQQMLQQTEDRMLTVVRHASRAPALAPQIDGIEQGLRQMIAATADQSAMRDTLLHLQDQIEGLIARPAPAVDLSIQRQGVAQFLESMGTVIRRLEAAIDRMDAPARSDSGPQLLDIADHLTIIVQQLDDMGAARVDLSPVLQAVNDLREDVGRSDQVDQPTAGALQHLAQRIDALAQRPDPVLDLTQQRQSFAQFGEAMAQILRRLDTAAEVFSAQPDSARILAETRALRTDLQEPFAKIDTQGQAITDLASRVAELADRPAPVPDLTAQRQGFAKFSTAMAQALRRLEDQSEKHVSHARDLHSIAAQAILGVMHSHLLGAGMSQTDLLDPAAPLRTALAEAMASEFMARGWQPVAAG